MNRLIRGWWAVSSSVGLVWGAAAPQAAHGATFLYQFGEVFSGNAPASTARPWVSAQIQDVVPGTVQLTLSNPNLTGNENVDSAFFNLNPNLDPTKLTFSLVSKTGSFDTPTISAGADKYKASSGGKFDLEFSFQNGGTALNRFTAGESVVYQITCITGLTAADFGYLSTPSGPSTPFYAAAHVQRIGSNGSNSGWLNPTGNLIVTVPEPTSATLCLVIGGGWLVLGHRRRRG